MFYGIHVCYFKWNMFNKEMFLKSIVSFKKCSRKFLNFTFNFLYLTLSMTTFTFLCRIVRIARRVFVRCNALSSTANTSTSTDCTQTSDGCQSTKAVSGVCA